MEHIPKFVARKNGLEHVSYDHRALEEVLEETYGIVVYQDQVMRLAVRVAGYSMGEADLLRRAMGKKKPEELAKHRDAFIERAGKLGTDDSTARKLFDIIEPFAGYAFNKAHAAAYTVITCQTAFLKAVYPREYMAGLLSAEKENAEKVAEAIQRIQSAHGNAAFAVLSGASLTTEKAYLMGKFARVCLKTPYIDYNGRLCMVSAGAGNKLAFGIDRAANAWDDILSAEVVWISGANVAECAPITTHYVWQARENGARVIIVDPRITPIARTWISRSGSLVRPTMSGRVAAKSSGGSGMSGTIGTLPALMPRLAR